MAAVVIRLELVVLAVAGVDIVVVDQLAAEANGAAAAAAVLIIQESIKSIQQELDQVMVKS